MNVLMPVFARASFYLTELRVIRTLLIRSEVMFGGHPLGASSVLTRYYYRRERQI